MSEEWRQIPGYPSRFQVSSLGRVRVQAYEYLHPMRGGGYRVATRPTRILKQFVNTARGGYLQVTMTFTSGQMRKVWSGKVHRLVALAFVPNPEGLPEVNHIDSNKLNNSADNIEWVTKSGNILHSYASGTRKKHSKTTPVRGTNANGHTVDFPSMLAAHKAGFQMGSIARCIAGTQREHKGYVWERM